MKIGIAKDIITPYQNMTMAGYAVRKDKFKLIHDDLYVKAVMFKDNKKTILILSLDLCSHSRDFTEMAKDYAAEKYGVAKECTIVNFTHTHAGPTVKRRNYRNYSDEYENYLTNRVKTCIDKCFLNSFNGSLSYGTIEGIWNINRRVKKNGTVDMDPNLGGVTDRTLHILKLEDEEQNIKGIVINYACHPVTLGSVLDISSEYPGRTCVLLDAMYYGCTSLFLQGAGGNARPLVTADGLKFKQCSFSEVDDMARTIAYNVRDFISSGKMNSIGPTLDAISFSIPLEYELKSKDFYENIIKDENTKEPLRESATKVLEKYDTYKRSVPLDAGVIKLCDNTYIVHLGGEICAEVKHNIVDVCKGKNIIFLGYTNEVISYIPDDKINEEGGYEAEGYWIEFGISVKYKKGIDDAINSRVLDAIKKLETNK
jgi:neutral ceramidase